MCFFVHTEGGVFLSIPFFLLKIFVILVKKYKYMNNLNVHTMTRSELIGMLLEKLNEVEQLKKQVR